MSELQIVSALLSGVAVGFSLGLIGGGGSVLAVPLLFYVVGVASPHVAIGTSAVAVTASALLNLAGHARARTVKWPCAVAFAVFGVAGAALGAHAGKMMDGQKLLALFGVLMLVVAVFMMLRRAGGENPDVRLSYETSPKLLPPLALGGLAVGFVSGFFGIGGGFLIVPGLVAVTAMPLLNAVGSSLVSVGAYGATTAASYAAAGFVDWPIAGLFVLGGAGGGLAGLWSARRLAGRRNALTRVFAGIVGAAGVYVLARGVIALV